MATVRTAQHHSSRAYLQKAPRNRGRQRRSWRRYGSQYITGYSFIAPFIIVFAIFMLLPNLLSLKLSFQQFSGFGEAKWVGLANYKTLLHYHVFWTELFNTVFYWLIHAAILVPLAFVLALLVRAKSIRGQRFWLPLIFIPQVVNVIAVTLTFKVIFATHSGILNTFLGMQLSWLQDPTLTRWVLILLLVWEGLGFWFVVFVAGLATLDPSLEEAASLDGAGVIRRSFSIVLPAIKPLVLFAVVIDAINSVRLYAEPNVLAGSGGSALADPSVATVSNLVVTNLNAASFGASAAAGWVLFIFTLVVTAVILAVYWVSDSGNLKMVHRAKHRTGHKETLGT